MTLSKLGQYALACAASISVGIGISACTSGSIDFLYVTASKNNPGQVAVYRVDTQSGTLTALQSPVYPTGRNPVALVIAPNQKNIYIVNHDDNTIVDFAIGTDGKLYPEHTYNTPGTCPSAAAIDPAGTFLYVVDTFQPNVDAPNCAQLPNSGPGAGDVVVYPVMADGSLGTKDSPGVPVTNTTVTPNISYFPVGNAPAAIAVLPSGGSVYVVNKADATIGEFSSASGVLTSIGTIPAGAPGSAPVAIAATPNSGFIYVTESAKNSLAAYSVGSSGALTAISTISVGNLPDGVTVDPDGKFLYVANYNDNNLTAYAIGTGAATSGVPTAIGTTFATGTGPTCVIVEPSLQHYVYTSNFLDSTVSGFELDGSTGALTPIQRSPYFVPGAAGQPTCIGAVKHGKHPPIA